MQIRSSAAALQSRAALAGLPNRIMGAINNHRRGSGYKTK
jgi:hypothetical protein